MKKNTSFLLIVVDQNTGPPQDKGDRNKHVQDHFRTKETENRTTSGQRRQKTGPTQDKGDRRQDQLRTKETEDRTTSNHLRSTKETEYRTTSGQRRENTVPPQAEKGDRIQDHLGTKKTEKPHRTTLEQNRKQVNGMYKIQTHKNVKMNTNLIRKYKTSEFWG